MPKDKEFLKEFECGGQWWLPTDKRRKLSGTLKFDIEKGGSLKLEGDKKHTWNLATISKNLVIFGTTDKGEISLFNCKFKKSKDSINELSNILFECEEGIIGAHISNMDSILIRSLNVSFSYLSKWGDSFGVSNREFLISFVREKEEFSFKFPQPLLLAQGNGYKIYLEAKTEKSFSFTDMSKQIIFSEIPYIDILLQGKNTFKDYQDFIKSIQYFLTPAVREQVFPLIVTGVTSDSKQLTFFSRLFSTPVSESLLVANFALSDIQENIKEYLQNWLDNRDELNSACGLYFSSLDKNINPELRFLYLIQAVEGLHRAIYKDDKYMTDEEYRKEGGLYETFIKVIPDSISPDFKQSLKDGKLYYANEYSLKKRLKEMLDDTYIDIINIRKTIVKKEELDGFIDKIVKTRNYYVHQDKELKDKILKGEELERAIEALKASTEIVLISEMGISVEEIKELRRTLHPL